MRRRRARSGARPAPFASRGAALGVVLAALATAQAARAADPPPADRPPAARPQPTAPAAPPDEARGWAVPPGTEPEDVGLFLPRVLLTPPRLVLQIAFLPIRETVRFVERHAIPERIEDVLYNDARTAGIVPTASYETTVGPTFGVEAFHEDLAGHGEAVAADAEFGGRYLQAYEVAFEADRLLGTRVWVESLARFEMEPRLLFSGLGDPPEAGGGSALDPRAAAVETRFRETRFLALLGLGYTIGDPGNLTQLGATAILNHRAFEPTTDEEARSVEQVYDTARLPGWDDGVRTLELDATFRVDTREPAGATARGVHLELFGGGVPRLGDHAYVHYGGEITGYFDLYRGTRVLVLRAAHEATAGDDDDIPFSDLPRLGGPVRLRGYERDRFRDKTSLLGTLEYHYPIHEFVAGALFLDVGRVAPGYDRLFELDTEGLRVGGGGGFVVRSEDRIYFSVELGYGDGLHLYFTTDPLRAFAKRSKQL